MERKHKRITSVANCYANLSRYEQGIYAEILGDELDRLKAQNLPAAGLVKFGQAPKAFIAFAQSTFSDVGEKGIRNCSTRYLENGGQASSGDVILIASNLNWDCGMLHTCFSVGQDSFVYISLDGFKRMRLYFNTPHTCVRVSNSL